MMHYLEPAAAASVAGSLYTVRQSVPVYQGFAIELSGVVEII